MDFKDIPQGARLCLAIYSLYDDKTKKKKKKREVSYIQNSFIHSLLTFFHLKMDLAKQGCLGLGEYDTDRPSASTGVREPLPVPMAGGGCPG